MLVRKLTTLALTVLTSNGSGVVDMIDHRVKWKLCKMARVFLRFIINLHGMIENSQVFRECYKLT